MGNFGYFYLSFSNNCSLKNRTILDSYSNLLANQR
jgi:hypothetical protein